MIVTEIEFWLLSAHIGQESSGKAASWIMSSCHSCNRHTGATTRQTLLYKANSAFHPSGVVKWVPALAGKAKAGMVHSVSRWTRGVQVKLWDPLRTRAISERLRGAFTTRRYTNPRLPLPLPLQTVLSDVLTAVDNQQVTLLALLDLSAACDFVDHDILPSRLQSLFGLGVVLC